MKFISLVLFALYIIQMKSNKASEVIAFAKSKLGCWYIWGAKGEVLTKPILQQFKNKNPSKVNTQIANKWMQKEVYDCPGFVMRTFQKVGIKIIQHCQIAWKNVNWASKGEISKYPKNKVCIVYRLVKGKMEYTGISLGNGKVIYAKDEKSGVVEEAMPGKWTHWGIPKGLY